MLKQPCITNFFQTKSQKICDKQKDEFKGEFWEPLFYDRERVDGILCNLHKIKKECEDSVST